MPKTAALPVQACATRSLSDGDILTGKASSDDIDGNSIGSKSCCCELADIFILGHLGPVFRQHAAAERIDLAKGYGFETAGSLEAEIEPAYSCEER